MKEYPVFSKNEHKEDLPPAILKSVGCPSCGVVVAAGVPKRPKKTYAEVVCPKCDAMFLVRF